MKPHQSITAVLLVRAIFCWFGLLPISGNILRKVMAIMVLFLVLPPAMAGPEGIVIYKENKALPDGSARVIEFNSLRNMGTATNYYLPSGQVLRLTQFQPQFVINYPHLENHTIMDASQLADVARLLQSCQRSATTYPRSEPYLRAHIQRCEEIIRRVRAGEVMVDGSFMSGSEYKKLREQQQRIEEERIAEQRRKKRMAEIAVQRRGIENRHRKH